MRKLILFDVDGTLIRRGDPDHLAAIDYGVHTVFPKSRAASVTRVDFDGKVDRVIASEVLSQTGLNIPPEDPRFDGVFELAVEFYRTQWRGRSNGDQDLLPGVNQLIDALGARDRDYTLGLVTGGSRGIVRVKLERLGLDERFPVGAFGDEVANRPALVELALRRAQSHYRVAFAAKNTLVVGDTPHDVNCAHANGLACLAVATGKYSMNDLRASGADAVIETLENTREVIDLIDRLTS